MNHQLIPIGQVPEKIDSVASNTVTAWQGILRDHRGPRWAVLQQYVTSGNKNWLALSGSLVRNRAQGIL